MNLEMKSREVARTETEDLVVVRYSQNEISNDPNCTKRLVRVGNIAICHNRLMFVNNTLTNLLDKKNQLLSQNTL